MTADTAIHPITPEPGRPALAAKATSRAEDACRKDGTAYLGFWVYLMTDLVLFASLFATFAVLRAGNALAGLFSKPFALEETLILLASSFVAGMALLAARAGKRAFVLLSVLVTMVLGACFLALELGEFRRLALAGHGWQASGALSAYFTLVGTHGLHILIGLLWAAALCVSIAVRGLSRANLRKLLLWSAFWHFLDLVWIFIFTVVYLMNP